MNTRRNISCAEKPGTTVGNRVSITGRAIRARRVKIERLDARLHELRASSPLSFMEGAEGYASARDMSCLEAIAGYGLVKPDMEVVYGCLDTW